MSTLDEITKEKQRVSEALARVDLQRKKLTRSYPEGEIVRAEAAIDKQVTESIKRAEQAPFPPPKELYEDVLA